MQRKPVIAAFLIGVVVGATALAGAATASAAPGGVSTNRGWDTSNRGWDTVRTAELVPVSE